jgi:cell division septum initiation protein DivIVA
MTDTPETEELHEDICTTPYVEGHDYEKMLQHARELERERDEARETVESLTTTSFDILAALGKVRDERDRLAEALERLERTAGLPALEDDPARVQARKALQSLTNP